MPFQSPTVPVDILADGTYRLTADVVYEGRDDTFTVPAGFISDLATVPRFMTWLVPITGVHDRAAILHDWLCVELETWHRFMHEKDYEPPGVPAPGPASPRDTDGLFRRVLRELGVGLVRRWLFWTGVRWGAVRNPARRTGWWKDAPAVLGISLLALPFVALPALLCLAVVALDDVVERIR